MEPLDKETANKLFAHYRKQRDGIRKKPELAQLCLICGSVNIGPKAGEPGVLACRNCGFSWYRYECSACGKTVDGRDPLNPACRQCGWRICTCSTCFCPAAVNGRDS
jgi:DNA-directed RNA polymerase subunit RPC12/RpoP